MWEGRGEWIDPAWTPVQCADSCATSRFSTSKTTLNQIPETFFTSLMSGRIQSLRDETGAIFIDRDPDLFSLILNYLRWGWGGQLSKQMTHSCDFLLAERKISTWSFVTFVCCVMRLSTTAYHRLSNDWALSRRWTTIRAVVTCCSTACCLRQVSLFRLRIPI